VTKEIIEIPDGQGGMIETEAEKFSSGSKADTTRQQKTLEEEARKAREHRIGTAAEAHNNYVKAYATDHNMELEEIVAAMHLDMLNWREFYPKEEGGTKRYDEICDNTYLWFEENKNK
jgi:hypothetical protein